MFPVVAFPLYEETQAALLMRQAVSDALLEAHISRKEAAAWMGIKEPQLARQLAGEPGTHISLWRLAALPQSFWDAFDARRAEQRGAVLVSPELVTLLRGAATLRRAALKAAMTPRKVERAL